MIPKHGASSAIIGAAAVSRIAKLSGQCSASKHTGTASAQADNSFFEATASKIILASAKFESKLSLCIR